MRAVLLRLALCSFLTCSSFAPAMAYCVEETTAVPLGNQSVPVRSFSCGAESQRQPVVKITDRKSVV